VKGWALPPPHPNAPCLDSTPPLRVALTLPPWFDVPPLAYGGIESLVADLADALIARGHEVVLVGAGVNGTSARFLRTYEVAPSDRVGEALPEVLQAAWTNRYLESLELDVVHDHSLAGPLTANGRRTPTIVTTHGPCSGEMASYYRYLHGDVHLVAISESQRRLAPDLNWAGLVHNAIRVAAYPFQARKEDYVLFMGRFVEEKGAHLAIDAARAAGRRIVLAGKMREPCERAYFEAEIRPRLGRDTEFVGEADAWLKRCLYAGAHCLVFPIAWDEPFGLVMIEAMACGTPVVALRRGSVPEIVRDGVTGCVCERPAELPAAIDAAGAIAPQACHFDVSIMAAAYEGVYSRLARAVRQDVPAAEPCDLREWRDRRFRG
jgi:glycosyltransferase involved in cell wall biosynthesis